ncbi:MAG: DUF805 domain-containing protein [Erythrobacter sp.]
MDWMMMPLKRYAEFEGRSRRMEYWMFQLGQLIVFFAVFVIIALGGAATGGGDAGGVFGVIGLLLIFALALGLFIPNLAVAVRRLHDQDKSGWWYLIALIPFGSLVLLVFMLLEGTRGPNQYGPDPKGQGDAQTFA